MESDGMSVEAKRRELERRLAEIEELRRNQETRKNLLHKIRAQSAQQAAVSKE